MIKPIKFVFELFPNNCRINYITNYAPIILLYTVILQPLKT